MKLLAGLGGNQGDVGATFAHAAQAIGERFRLLAASSLWRTAPQGPPQPDFLNAALVIGLDVHPLQALAFFRQLEAAAGRERAQRWGPRPLDLDLLLVEDLVIASPALTLPHPQVADRRFVLLPAAEVAGSWRHPRFQRTIAELAGAAAPAGQDCERLGEFPFRR